MQWVNETKRRANDGFKIKGTYVESRSPDIGHDRRKFGRRGVAKITKRFKES
jgi:hypothetical protein